MPHFVHQVINNICKKRKTQKEKKLHTIIHSPLLLTLTLPKETPCEKLRNRIIVQEGKKRNRRDDEPFAFFFASTPLFVLLLPLLLLNRESPPISLLSFTWTHFSRPPTRRLLLFFPRFSFPRMHLWPDNRCVCLFVCLLNYKTRAHIFRLFSARRRRARRDARFFDDDRRDHTAQAFDLYVCERGKAIRKKEKKTG